MCNNSASAGAGFPLKGGWNPADREPIRASVATLVFPTKSPLNWARAHRPEGSLFGHWRSGMEFAQVSCRSTRRGVREHPAPSGALRHKDDACATSIRSAVREHPAPSGALRHDIHNIVGVNSCGQGAPSTIRCIETHLRRGVGRRPSVVREHPAPSGALRPCLSTFQVRCERSGSTQHHQVH